MTALRIFGCALALLAWIAPAWGQTTVTLQPGSAFWIEGRSSVNTFTCRVDTVHGHGQVADAPRTDSTTADPEATLRVPVRTFDCGKRQMTQDLQETLEANAHPMIQYKLKSAEIIGADSPEGWYRIRARGILTIAGTTRPVELNARGQRVGDHQYRLCGSQALQMSDFGIDPPTKLLGLIRVKDQIEVHFDLVAAPPTTSTASMRSAHHSEFHAANVQCLTASDR